MLTKAPRGTFDILPGASERWQLLEAKLRGVAERFGCREIRVPAFEHTELFNRAVGDTTDIAQKEMYTFEDRGGRSISLRPEGTASVVRAFIEHGLYGQALPFKVYYILPNFRYDKPQAGRFRQHHQFGVEIFGPPGPLADAELITLAHTFLSELGIAEAVTLNLNSIGCPDCRPGYHAALKAFLASRQEKLCHTCLGRIDKNPLRVLDCKSPVCAEAAQGAPAPLGHVCPGCQAHWDALTAALDASGVRYTRNDRLVRGLDYYTRTVFEFVTGGIGAQDTVCGGGRYDGLVAEIGGPPTPALGFGSGMERLLLTLDAQGIKLDAGPRPPGVFLAAAGTEANTQTLTHELRVSGIRAECDLMGRSLKAQMKYADKTGAKYTLVIGLDELVSGRGVLKDMETGTTTDVELTAESIRRNL